MLEHAGTANPVCGLLEKSDQKLAHLSKGLLELRQTECLYRSVFVNSPLAMYILVDGRIRLANPRFVKLAGYQGDELTGADFLALVVPEDRPVASENAAQMLRAERFSPYRFRIACKNGESRWVMAVVAAIRYGGRQAVLGHLVTLAHDALGEQQPGRRTCGRYVLQPILGLAAAVEKRDPATGSHQRRTASLACAIAGEMGLSPQQADAISIAAFIHDVGKMCLPTELLSKPGRLTDEESALMKTHPQAGYDILKTMPLPRAVAPMVLQHHERLDGSGYSQGIAGDDILLEARIIAVADVVDAMVSPRPYRPALGIRQALEEISDGKTKLYDPQAADACISLFSEKQFTFEESDAQPPGAPQPALSALFA